MLGSAFKVVVFECDAGVLEEGSGVAMIRVWLVVCQSMYTLCINVDLLDAISSPQIYKSSNVHHALRLSLET